MRYNFAMQCLGIAMYAVFFTLVLLKVFNQIDWGFIWILSPIWIVMIIGAYSGFIHWLIKKDDQDGNG